MSEPTAAPLDELIERITTWPYGMPVRAMERVRAMGEPTIPALAGALARWREDEERDLLWLIVLLGEIGSSAAVPPLIEQMRRTDLDVLALAAAEGLAKVGPAALPALADVAQTGDPVQRLYAYAALGWIRDDRAYATLTSALGRDAEMGDVLATALADQGRPEAVPLLYEAYRECEPWQRPEFEEALQELHWRRRVPQWTRDWRLRYRRRPALGSFDLEWVGISAIVRRDPDRMSDRPTLPLRALEAIVGEEPEPDEIPETCEDCGGPVEQPTGLPTCPETAVSVTVYQLRFLGGAREDGLEDLFDLLDELEGQEEDFADRDEPITPDARDRWRDELDELRMCRRTCEWLIEQGAETVGPARARLLAEAARLADLHGDPEGLLRPVRPAPARGARVGRNDPCPCGSGRKYKRCCLGKT